MKWSLRRAALGLATVFGLAVFANAQTPFSFQGQVRNAGVPVNGACDVVLELQGLGVPVGTVSTHLATPCVNGLFTINNAAYADALWTGVARSIRVWVRFPAGGGGWPAGYTALAPNVPVTATPYAYKSATVVDNGVTSAAILNGAVTTDDILNGTIATVDIGNLEVTNAKIADVAWSKLTGVPLGFADGVDNTSAFSLPFSDPGYADAAVAFSVVATNGTDIFNARINNPASAAEVFQGTSNGVGNTMETQNTGTGRAFYANIANGASSADAALITTNGTGSAAVLTTPSAANASPTVEVTQNGSGAGILVTAGSGRGIDIVGTTGTGLNITTTSGDAIAASVSGNNNAVQGTVGGTAAGIFGRNNSATTGWGGYFWMANAANTGTALQAINSGTGRAGLFQAGNAANTANAVEITHAGSGAALYAQNTGTGNAARFLSDAANNAAIVQIDATANGPGLDINASGTAEAFRVTNTGTDNTMEISVSNGTSTSATVLASHNGPGYTVDASNADPGGKAGRFRNTSATNNQRTVEISNAGSGNALFATNTGNGAAAYFSNPALNSSAVVIIDSTTQGPALDINAAGAAEAFRVTNTGSDNAMEIGISNAANGLATISASHTGTGFTIDAYNSNATGKAARFRTTSATNSQDTVSVTQSGTGSAATFFTTLGTNSNNSVEVTQSGTGRAGLFTNNNSLGFATLRVVNSNASGLAGSFSGDVAVLGNLSKTTGTFRIDHPLDPANKYLIHSFVESPDMMNIYNGNITTNENGEAWVQLPGYFDALNMEFRYQLTCMGQFAQAIVAVEIENNRFQVKTDKPNVKVSWQVTGVRKDPYAMDHRIVPEVEKPDALKGYFIYPQGYARPDELNIRNAPVDMATPTPKSTTTNQK